GGGDPLSLLTRHFLDAGRGSMRKLVLAACAAGLAIALSSATATAASASAAAPAWGPGGLVGGPRPAPPGAGHRAPPGETAFPLPGVYHQSVQIRTDDITLRGSGAFKGGTVLMPPKKAPNTLCNQIFGPTGICILAKKVNPSTGDVITPVRGDRVTGIWVGGFA